MTKALHQLRTLAQRASALLLACALPLAGGLGCGGIGAQPDAELGNIPTKGPVGKTFRDNSEKFLACGRDSVTVQTGASQLLDLRFIVSPDGRVQKARVEEMSMPDPDLQGCVLRALKKVQFPRPKDGKPKEIKYPLTLRP